MIQYGKEYINHQKLADGQLKVQLRDGEVQCKYLVGADGVKSRVREALGIEMVGTKNIQNFVNVHFRSKELGEKMIKSKEVGMLYFLYNPSIVSVLVCHDIE